MSKGFNNLGNRKFQLILVVIVILMYVLFYFPVPYYIIMPGSAIELDTLIKVEDGYQEQGEFMLTSVSMRKGNLISIISSKFDSFSELIPQELIIEENEDQDDFTNRQIQVMDQSQNDAIIAALTYLKLPVDIENNGILVMGILANTPSKKILEIGDLIVKVDGESISSIDDIIGYFDNKKENELVKIDFIRDGKKRSEEIPLVTINSEGQDNKVGLGIYLVENRVVSSEKNVEFIMSDIGGPSAGLMFSLEIINQLLVEDLTKGYIIAGTGTINNDGEVGQIGSPRLKIKTAATEGAEIFFIPKDINEDDSNEKESVIANKDLGSPMDIVPVANLSEAVEYLNKLTKKNK